MDVNLSHSLILLTFIIGYLAIILEFYIKVNKTAVGIFIAGICWMFYFLADQIPLATNQTNLAHHLSEVSQVIFFLLGAMTIVELIDSHKGFASVIKCIKTRSKRKVMIIISVLAFFLSSILDNLTTTILLISILRKLVPSNKDRLALGCLVVIAANAGGAWTPIGDVTTTMLWIHEKISTVSVIRSLFLPSLACLIVPLICFLIPAKGNYGTICVEKQVKEPGARLVFWLGLASLIAVPVIKWATGLPPYMGVLIGLAILWLVTDVLHFRYEERNHLRVPFILAKVDVSSVLFFLGILLTITALDSIGILTELATWINNLIPNVTAIATLIGLFSSIIDNVPLVAATMGMYNFPMDHNFWLLTAYTAGTGGSILSIGSAAGVALMGLEKVDFISYMKTTTVPALLGYFAGIGIYLWLG